MVANSVAAVRASHLHHSACTIGRPASQCSLIPAWSRGRRAPTSPSSSLRPARPAPREALAPSLRRRCRARVGLGVERGAAGQDAAQVVHRLAAGRHRPGVALRGDARHVLLGRRLQPDRRAVRRAGVEGRRLGDDAARRGDHRLGVRRARSRRARAARSAGRRRCRRGRGSRGCCSRRSARSRGSARRTARSSASASSAPSVDLPAPRRPISAMRRPRAGSRAAGRRTAAPSATRARRRSASPRRAAARAASATRASCVVTSPTQLGEGAVERARRPAAAPGSTRCRCRTRGWRGGAPTRPTPRRPPCASGRGARAAGATRSPRREQEAGRCGRACAAMMHSA